MDKVICKYCNKRTITSKLETYDGCCSKECLDYFTKAENRKKFIEANTIEISDTERIVNASSYEELEILTSNSTFLFNEDVVFPNQFLVESYSEIEYDDDDFYYDDEPTPCLSSHEEMYENVYTLEGYIKKTSEKIEKMKNLSNKFKQEGTQ